MPKTGRLPAVLLTLVCPFLLSGCQRVALLQPAGPIGAAQRTILLNALAIMLCIIVPVIVGTIAFAWWFREGNARARRLPHWSFSGRIEIVTWSVPLLTIMFLGGIAWIGAHDLDPFRPVAQQIPSERKPLTVQVVALDWKWLFLYPEQGVASLNELVLPAGTPVHFDMTSASVMNTFFVPQLGGMIYVMNGMTTQLNLKADAPGEFYGLSGHYSGDGFSNMHFMARALDDRGFAAWVAGARASADALDGGAYRTLTRQSLADPVRTYRLAEPGLFKAVTDQALPPGPGPERGRPNPAVMPLSPPPTTADTLSGDGRAAGQNHDTAREPAGEPHHPARSRS